jgi:hypothetical protein
MSFCVSLLDLFLFLVFFYIYKGPTAHHRMLPASLLDNFDISASN